MYYLVGGFTPLKNISHIGSSSQLLGNIKHVSNHQPGIYMFNIGRSGSMKTPARIAFRRLWWNIKFS